MSSDARVGSLAALYSAEAESYARTWAPVLRPMGGVLVEALAPARARRILDVGTGTGVLHAALRTAAPRATVIGVDRAEGMLRAARAASDVPVAVMDAVRLAVPDASLDAVVFSFVLHHMLDPVAALAEARRVLGSDGVLGAATWGEHEECPALELWTDALDEAGAPDDDEITIANHDLLDTEEKLEGILADAGFGEVKVWMRRFAHPWTREEFLDYVLHAGRRRRRLDGLGAAKRRAFLQELSARLDALAPGGFAYTADVVFAITLP